MPYTIGLDFGTESGRALLVDVATGRELATAVHAYPHGVIDRQLPDGTALGAEWALQHPGDWLAVIETTVPRILAEAGIDPAEVVGIGLDCTACTVVPVDASGQPLCLQQRWAGEPNAWVKLWKHHAAQDWADRCNAVAAERGETWPAQYGGKISSEWLWPKLAQIAAEAPAVYAEAADFVEATDWLTWQLSGELVRSACCAGYKACWDDERSYPSEDFLRAVHPDLVTQRQRMAEPTPLGRRCGGLTGPWAAKLGLREGTAIAVGLIDAHAAVPAVGSAADGVLVTILGTSSCDLLCGGEKHLIGGMNGVVRDGILPGSFGYEAGQGCFGDHFAWFSRFMGAGDPGHEQLTAQAEAMGPGGGGVIALDWWNGNRSILQDQALTGALIGMNLHTDPAAVYRALIEGLAMGKRTIVGAFEDGGVPVARLVASGGIADKNPLLMQVFADVIGKPIAIARSEQGCALGAAIHGAVAAGAAAGGHADFASAAAAMGGVRDRVFEPDPTTAEAYAELYACYHEAHEFFGRQTDLMRRLRALRR